MPAMVLVLLGLLYIKAVVMEECCCTEKEVGNIRYELISKENTSAYGCESDCVYQQEGVPTERFCFKAGHLKFHCIEEFPEWMAVRIIPGAFDIARGHYVEHPIDTDYIHKLNNPNSRVISCPNSPWRPISGECNNLKHPHWGATGTYYQRFIANAYADRTGSPRGGCNPSTLPSPRKISQEFHKQLNRTALHLTNLFWQFGQYVGHDTGLTPEVNLDHKISGGFNNTACASDPKFNTSKKCFNINVSNDPFYKPILPTYPWLGFARTLPNHYAKEKTIRQQVNAGTGFMDASITYGFNDILTNQLRTNYSGLLISGANNLLPIINDTVGPSNPNFSDPSVNVENIAAGDPRVNLDPWLLSVQTMFFREHNRLAKELNLFGAEDELIFQTARWIVIAEYQNIIFNEFIPLVIGNDAMKEYRLFTNISTEYNETINPTIHNGFQTAAARFGHSMVQNSMQLQNLKPGPEAGKPLDHKLYLNKSYFDDSYYKNGSGYSEVLGGLSIGRCQHFDRYVEDGVRNFLFDVQGKNNYGDDLASRNIQRGRDHGLPGYMKYREFCGLSYGGQGDIDNPNWNKLMQIYENKPDDIDVWTGGLAETPSEGAIVGPLFQCLLGKQYHNLKYGDRFFFTHSNQKGSFTDQQLTMIRSRTMRDILCQNSDSPKIRMHAMEIRDGEELIDCTEQINQLNAADFL